MLFLDLPVPKLAGKIPVERDEGGLGRTCNLPVDVKSVQLAGEAVVEVEGLVTHHSVVSRPSLVRSSGPVVPREQSRTCKTLARTCKTAPLKELFRDVSALKIQQNFGVVEGNPSTARRAPSCASGGYEKHHCTFLVEFLGNREVKSELSTGAARGTRTPDPLITNEVLYRLSYCGARRLVRLAEA